MNNFDERKKEIDDLIAQAKKAIEDGDLEKARNIKADIDAKKQEFEELKQLSTEIEDSAPEGSEDEEQEEEPPAEPEKQEEETEGSEEIEEPTEEELEEEEEEKKKKEEAKRSMAKIQKNQELSEETLAFEEYMKTKGAKRDNVKS
ncbi:MAG: phage major capsid protein, partial [Lactococcus lactis]|nr:phage major capsid protein [Lactococcus lactis]